MVPAALDPDVNDKIRAIAVEAYQALGCCGMARVDVFLTPDNEVVINEINTCRALPISACTRNCGMPAG